VIPCCKVRPSCRKPSLTWLSKVLGRPQTAPVGFVVVRCSGQALFLVANAVKRSLTLVSHQRPFRPRPSLSEAHWTSRLGHEHAVGEPSNR
jgi:hypothetical protein